MIPNNPQSPDNSVQAGYANGEPEVARLRHECERLQQLLAAAEKERDENRSMLYAYARATITEEEKAEMERRVLDAIENGGVPFREALDQLKQSRGSK